jgi:hypothetical protein
MKSKLPITNYESLISIAWKEKAYEIAKLVPFNTTVVNDYPDLALGRRNEHGKLCNRDKDGSLREIYYPIIVWYVDSGGVINRDRRNNDELHIKNSETEADHYYTEVRTYPEATDYKLTLCLESLNDFHSRWLSDCLKSTIRERDILTVDKVNANLDRFSAEDQSSFLRYKFNNDKFYRIVFAYTLQGWFDRYKHGVKASKYPVARTITTRHSNYIESEAE